MDLTITNPRLGSPNYYWDLLYYHGYHVERDGRHRKVLRNVNKNIVGELFPRFKLILGDATHEEELIYSKRLCIKLGITPKGK